LINSEEPVSITVPRGAFGLSPTTPARNLVSRTQWPDLDD
jgi:hypothetical protein